MGRFVHTVLEQLHALPSRERSIERARTLAGEEKQRLSADAEYTALDLDDARAPAFRWKAWRSLESALHLEDPTSVDSAGQEVRLDTHVAGVRILGFADRINHDGQGGLVVTDYKTGSAPKPQWQGDKLLLMDLYALMIEAAWGSRPVAHRLLFLGNRVEVRTKVNDARCLAAVETLESTWEAVGTACASGEFKARESGLCGYCSFRPHCPVWGGEVVTEVPVTIGERLPLAV